MLRFIVVAILFFGLADQALAQDVQMRTVEERAGGTVLEITANWPTSLRAALDSSGVVQFDARAVTAAVGGYHTAPRTLMLPVLAQPRVRVLSSDYDEVALPKAPDADELIADLSGDLAEAVGLGIERKKAAATLQTRLVSYDAERGVLRRYRRVVVAVDYAKLPRDAQTSDIGFSIFSGNQVERSVLADGVVYKIPITEEGLYRIDRTFLSNLPGLESPGSIDPNHIKVYSNGGAPLPALNSAPRPVDLIENPVFVRGGGDNSFGNGDAVFFYGRGPAGWEYNVADTTNSGVVLDPAGWDHYVHPFDTNNYYFIKISNAASAQVGQASYPGFTDATQVAQVEGRYFLDLDEFMWSREAGTGHTWVSNRIFGGQTRQVLNALSLPGLAAGTLRYEARTAIGSNPAVSAFFESNGTQLAEANFGGIQNSSESAVARVATVGFEQQVSAGSAVNLSIRLNDGRNSPAAVLDWVRVFYPKALQAQAGVLRFHTPTAQTGRFEMTLQGFGQEPQVWDVTESGTIRRLGVQGSGGTYRIQIEVNDPEQPRELIAFAESAVQSLDAGALCPEDASCRVSPQDLHGNPALPDLAIVTPAAFRAQADELAAWRRERDGLAVEVVDVQQIYNEFSGGQQDPRAIRDYFKFLYDRAPDEGSLLRYGLLFGDGHFNYRGLGEEPVLENWVPPYETEESFHPDRSYTSDDYFGLLDDDEGEWVYTFYNSPGPKIERVDIGIGRFTVQTAQEAQTVIDKIKRYESPETYGPWRSRYVFLADDGPTGLSNVQDDRDLHTQNIDVVAERVESVEPAINQKKIYTISYERVFLNGWRIPDAKEDLLTSIREGALVVNYSGHGGEFGLAQEEIFTIEDARNLQNAHKLPIFITATCSFGRWDLADTQSGAEVLLLNPDGGAIAMLTTVRTVYTRGGTTSLNVGLNFQLNFDLFQRDEQGLPMRLGDALRNTKNTPVGYEGNNRKFNLLGDPSMRIGLAPGKTAITAVNGIPVGEQTAPIKALDQITLAGEVQTVDGQLNAGFNGIVNLSVFDSKRQVAIDEEDFNNLRNPYYIVREDLIWRGKADVRAGLFAATFVVPKDISYSNESGRISVYAFSDETHAEGYTENVLVGGTADNPPNDADGPEIDVYINSETFASGGLTSPRPRVIIKLFDASGINTVGAGVGHEMLLIVDGDEQNAINIGDLYESEENSFQRGQVVYEFEEPLSDGPHTLTVRAWDVLNNSGSTMLDLTVADASELAIQNVFNYPNPTAGPTRFIFEHNQPIGTPAKVQIRVYTLSGRPVLTLERNEVLMGGPVQVTWDGLDDDLDRLASGVYLYKVRVEVDGTDGERHVSEHLEKLAVIR